MALPIKMGGLTVGLALNNVCLAMSKLSKINILESLPNPKIQRPFEASIYNFTILKDPNMEHFSRLVK